LGVWTGEEVGLGNGRLAGHSSIWERRDGGAGGRELIRLTTALSEWLQIGGALCFSGRLCFCQYM
jgi:hypothetical protein